MTPVRLACPHVTECPACPLWDTPYPAQLALKQALVVKELMRYPELGHAGVTEVAPADPTTWYRRRAKLVCAGSRLGLYTEREHAVVDLPQCQVLDPTVARVASALRAALPLSVPLEGTDIRAVEGGVLLTLIVPDGTPLTDLEREGERLMRDIPGIVGLAASFRARGAVQLLGRRVVVLSGASQARDRTGESGPYVLAAHGSFAQAHGPQEERLKSAIVEALRAAKGELRGLRVLELFAGSGALALMLAARGARVTAVESFAPAADLAQRAARDQSLTLDIRAEDATAAARALAAARRPFDAVVVDPPRRGLTPETRAAIAALSPSVVVYVSCAPETLGRDLADLCRHGFTPSKIVPFDLMPWTAHVETLVTLHPATPPAPVLLHADDRLLAVVKSPHEPTTPQGEHQGSLLERVRRAFGSPEAVPVHRLDVGTSGVCLFARRPEHVAELSEQLRQGDKRYVALARGVTRPKGSIRRPLPERGRAREARTRYARKGVVGGHSLIEVMPDEGRKHQIRRHLAAIGHPVLGDARYGDAASNEHFEMCHGLDRTFLHCARITLPRAGGPLDLVAPMPGDLAAVLESLQRVD